MSVNTDCVCVTDRGMERGGVRINSLLVRRVYLNSILFECLRFCLQMCILCLFLTMYQHQQQVVQAVERAKQVTMAELNAIIGVSDL